MKKSILISFILTLFYPFALEAETWSCSYLHENNQKVFIRERVSGGFQDPTYARASVEIILRENERFIHLYSPQDHFTSYYASVLDKKNMRFSMVALKPGVNSDIIEGDCVVY
tara:strand:- start:229 stop:567 length:339 start_codon:yes stop_codon:yes gene_type:complete